MLGAKEGWVIEVAGGGGHDLVTLAPIIQCGEAEAAALGLVNMMNAGGAVREFALQEEGAGTTVVPQYGTCRQDVTAAGCLTGLCTKGA